jgi:hypothetical protein
MALLLRLTLQAPTLGMEEKAAATSAAPAEALMKGEVWTPCTRQLRQPEVSSVALQEPSGALSSAAGL